MCYILGFPHSLVGKESAYSAGDPSSITRSGRSPGEGNGNPFPWRIPWMEEPGQLQFMGSQELDIT